MGLFQMAAMHYRDEKQRESNQSLSVSTELWNEMLLWQNKSWEVTKVTWVWIVIQGSKDNTNDMLFCVSMKFSPN